ncbi:uncharacterized protein J8A68_000549 [[Candida] subhashii]|uniref:Enoyl reductase (ER) domain-containing protein n=1 Tax=[Candida] subhashii TaxID=561895 RepID=A0A8J5URY1_9ASCO|nr:uncharacterized protein J8A68_000549 [[Candida] subhashii]KAG7665926.1 hypothetical protein J8A68_000549 [[Candida] subhashii]
MSIPNIATRIHLKTAPTTDVNLNFGEEDSTFEIKQVPVSADLKSGEILVKTLYLSNDPTQRTWIQKGSNPARAYIPPILEGDIMLAAGIGEIVKSNSEKYKVGDIITSRMQWADYIVLNEAQVNAVIDPSAGFPLPYYLSVFGLTSLTALFGWTEAGKLKRLLENPEEGKNLTVCVSAASGATGSMAIQIAKHILGIGKVIGITGSDEKCKLVEGIGADLCVNFNDPEYKTKISEYVGNEFIDVYFDNVGGEILSFLLTKIKKFGRIVACGAISGYQNRELSKVTNWNEIITSSLTVEGFIVLNYRNKFPEGIKTLVGAIQSGKIKAKGSYNVEELTGDDPIERLQQIPQIWKTLFTGKPAGKLLTKVA